MKKVRMVAFGVLTLISAIGSNALAADPIMTSLTSGAQAPVQICGGDTATYPLTITRTNNGNMEIYLTASGLPAGATASLFSLSSSLYGRNALRHGDASIVHRQRHATGGQLT